MARQKINGNQVNNALFSKVVSFTRDGTAASGDVSYTGVGFMPTSLECFMTVDGTLYTSEAASDSTKVTTGKYQAGANVWYIMTTIASYTNYSGWAQTAVIKSYDADGFTLTWTKAGAVPAGTMRLGFICKK